MFPPGILGHADPRVIEKVKAACEEGLTFWRPDRAGSGDGRTSGTAGAIHGSQPSGKLRNRGNDECHPCCAGYTKRDKIIKFRGCYHGHSDGLLVKAGSAALTTFGQCGCFGRFFGIDTLDLPEYNFPDKRALFEAYRIQRSQSSWNRWLQI